jgi:hypothetical protein
MAFSKHALNKKNHLHNFLHKARIAMVCAVFAKICEDVRLGSNPTATTIIFVGEGIAQIKGGASP